MLKSGEMSAECGEITLRVMGADEGSLCYLHPFNGFESLKGNGRGEVMNYDRSILALSPEDVERASEGALVAVGCRACVMVFFCVPSVCNFSTKASLALANRMQTVGERSLQRENRPWLWGGACPGPGLELSGAPRVVGCSVN